MSDCSSPPLPEGAEVLPSNPSLEGLVVIRHDEVFSEAVPGGLKLQLICPQNTQTAAPVPCMVFVQGSAWVFPDVWYELGQLCSLAARGFAVASVTHRSILDGNPFPAGLQDVKTAVRWLRAHAADLHIDPHRIGIWGTSSGGHMALMTGITAGDPEYRTGEYAGEDDGVSLVVDCFGPADLVRLLSGTQDLNENRQAILRAFLGGHEADKDDFLRQESPYWRAEPGRTYPPFLILQGSADYTVPPEQSILMTEKLRACGAHAEYVCIEGAPHEGIFWSRAVLDRIFRFIETNL